MYVLSPGFYQLYHQILPSLLVLFRLISLNKIKYVLSGLDQHLVHTILHSFVYNILLFLLLVYNILFWKCAGLDFNRDLTTIKSKNITCDHCIRPLYQTTVSDHCIRPLYQTTVSDHCIRPLYQTTVSDHCIICERGRANVADLKEMKNDISDIKKSCQECVVTLERARQISNLRMRKWR